MNKSVSTLSLISPKSTTHSSRQFLSPNPKKRSPDVKKKIRLISSKISELLFHKKKILKCIQQVEIKLKKTYVQEQELLKSSELIENKIKSLERKKSFALCTEPVSDNMRLIIKLRRFLDKFRKLHKEEIELEDLENDLAVKEFDYSLDTSSTATNFSSSKETIQKQLLRNKLCKVEMRSESLCFHTNISKMRKDFVYSNKSRLEADLRSFSMEKEIFTIKSNKATMLKQTVLRKEKRIKYQRERIKELISDVESYTKESDEFKQELEKLQIKFSRKRQKCSLEVRLGQVGMKLEKIGIISESIKKKEKVVQVHKERIKGIEEMLRNKENCVKAKMELLEILASIEKVASIPDPSNTKSQLVQQKKENLRVLIQQALKKEKEILAIEPSTHI